MLNAVKHLVGINGDETFTSFRMTYIRNAKNNVAMYNHINNHLEIEVNKIHRAMSAIARIVKFIV